MLERYVCRTAVPNPCGIPRDARSPAHGAQARCLFGLDAETWDAVLAALVDAKFLSQTHNGMFAIASNTGVATGRTAGIGVDSNVTR